MTGPTGKFQHLSAGKGERQPLAQEISRLEKAAPAMECHIFQARDHASRFSQYLHKLNFISETYRILNLKFWVSEKCMETHQTAVPDTATNEPNLRKVMDGGDFASIPDRFDTSWNCEYLHILSMLAGFATSERIRLKTTKKSGNNFFHIISL